jgi:hypothetical protein
MNQFLAVQQALSINANVHDLLLRLSKIKKALRLLSTGTNIQAFNLQTYRDFSQT